YWQSGTSTVVVNSAVAGAIFGGSLNGIQNGNSNALMNGGHTNGFYGGGFGESIHQGNAEASLMNGQVNNQMNGGSNVTGNPFVQLGNITATMTDGVLNGSILGFRGTVGNFVKGNSVVQINGGQLDGTPSNMASKLLTGGSDGGNITGNVELDVNLTGASTYKTTKLPGGTVISGTGAIIGGASKAGGSGSGATNTTTLNLTVPYATDPNNSTLNGATIYGDASTGANSNFGKNTITIDANNNIATSVYATNYNSAQAGGLKQATTINFNQIHSVGTISGGGPSDDFQNTTTNGANKAVINAGNATTAIALNTSMLKNFTSLNLADNSTIGVNGGLLNGGNATAANHGSTYSNFGDVKIGKGSWITMGGGSLASIGKLTTSPGSQLFTPYWQTTGNFNLSDLDMSQGTLTWHAWNDPKPSTINNVYNGSYYGTHQGFPILTFTGGNSANAIKQLTKANWTGTDFQTATTYQYVGDIQTSNNIAYMVPSTTGDYSISNSPTSIDFGSHPVTSKTQTLYPTYNGDLVVSYTGLDLNVNGWTLYASQTTPLSQVDASGNVVAGGKTLDGNLSYSDGTNKTIMNNAQTFIASQDPKTNGTYNITNTWGSASKKGFVLDVPTQKQYASDYKGTITWTLSNVPTAP
ncbi:MAG: WxL domain-containing protein, partial [Streptococcaceae bacterium]|nr:WxL domain-containing protein [Streptococcaceae bacterium]